MNTLYTQSAATLKEWQALLDRQDIHHESGFEGDYMTLKTTARGIQLVREEYGLDATITDKIRSNIKINKVLVPLLGAVLLLFGVMLCAGGDNDREPTAEELRRERFDSSSDFGIQLTMRLRREYVRNPSTFELEDYRILTHNPDSVTVVVAFSSENDFGVRKTNSVTVTADNDITTTRVVSAQ